MKRRADLTHAASPEQGGIYWPEGSFSDVRQHPLLPSSTQEMLSAFNSLSPSPCPEPSTHTLIFLEHLTAGTVSQRSASHCQRSAMLCQLHTWRRPIFVNTSWTNLPGSHLHELLCMPRELNTRFRDRIAQIFPIVPCFFTGLGRHTRLCFMRPLIDTSDC